MNEKPGLQQYIDSLDPKQFDQLRPRIDMALDLCLSLANTDHRSLCVASTMAFTHLGQSLNYDSSTGVNLPKLKEFAQQLAELAQDRIDLTEFWNGNFLTRDRLNAALKDIQSAWIGYTDIHTLGGHVLGILYGRHAKEFLIWDSQLKFGMWTPYSVQEIVDQIQNEQDKRSRLGAVISFRSK